MTELHPLLVGDVGGTNARFGYVARDGQKPHHLAVYRTSDHASLEDAITHYLHDKKLEPVAGVVAVAAPVPPDATSEIHFTNNPWRFTMEGVRDRFGWRSFTAINDFIALASAAPHLTPDDLLVLQEGEAPRDADGFYPYPLAVLGPGPGMGIAALAPVGGLWAAIASEGGHVDLPVVTDEEIAVYRYLRARHGSVSAEFALAGQGLARLYAALAALRSQQIDTLTPAEITQAALAEAGLARDATLMTLALIGGFAGNAALTFGARSGVYLGGGILPRLAPLIAQSDLCARFIDKPPHQDYMRAIPLRLIVAQEPPALLGAAAWLATSGLTGADQS